MKIYQKVLLSLSLIGLMTSCAPTTQLQKSWSDPSLAPGSVKPFNKILVIAALKDDASKRVAEDKIVASIKNSVGVQAYKYVQPTDTDQKMLEDKMKKDGFDGLILMRLKEVEKSTSYTPGTGYGGWYGYRYSSPGYYSEDKTYYVETTIYSLAESKLLWSGTTSSLNPTKFEQTMDGIIYAVKTDLQKRGLIKK